MRKFVALLVSLTVLLTACPMLFAITESEKSVVNFWYLWAGQEEIALKEAIERYNEQSETYVVKASLCDIPKQIAGMASGSGPDITDIVDNSVANLASKKIILPLDTYIAQESEMMADFIPAAMRQCTYKDQVWGLPINAMAQSMNYYNKTAFEKAGIEKLPETFEEFKQLIFDLTIVDEKGNIVQTGWPWTGSLGYNALAMLMGGNFYNEDMTEVTPDNEPMLEVLRFAQEYSKKFGVENIRKFNASLGGWISAQDSFFVGKQVIRADGWYLSRYIDLTGHGDDLDWGVFPTPTNEELKGAGTVVTSIFVIPARGNNPDGAWDFLKFLMAPENMAPLMAEFGNEPARFSAGTHPVFSKAPAFEDFFKVVTHPKAITFPGHAIEAEYSQALSAAVSEVLALKVSPEEAMANVKAKIQPVLDKANRK